ncbi:MULTISPECIES: AraC family ligand binding domain-containing protein [Bacillus]|uniref:AraC family transcriptional regulator n=2 Tax=Bacillus TaxID=1386 RepID=A0A0M4FV51_9BACI|nr:MULTISPECIES: AraC family transcriptional regulator [Bacillus]ALC82393.1 AraC family transcriptional regulator [Bacillus gobiensis]MBP1081269.1 AraC-like DNA-binding protein [Bacillus capparidis]MED1095947.1 AraC family transcriptional regulator [Bacillus capparidis]
MLNEVRTIYLDSDLDIEAYRFKGIMQKFPAHFHEYYVIGFIEEGQRFLACKGEEYIINPGDLLLFNPYDTHSCARIDGKTLDYRCINVTPEVMKKVMLQINGEDNLPSFKQNVLYRSELVSNLRELHVKITQEDHEFKKEELFYHLLEDLIQTYSDLAIVPQASETSHEIKTVCAYLEENYTKTIKLNDLSALTGWSKYHLLRSFTKQMGISPYSYLETIRVNHAKKMLEQGNKPIEVAFLTGFSDQSHLTKNFKSLVGLTPKQYMRIFESEGGTS